MKVFIVAVVAAFFCIAAVSAKTTLPSIEALELFLQRAQCGVSVMGKVIGDSKLKEDYEKFATSINKILIDDKKKCYEQNKSDQIQKCLKDIFDRSSIPQGEFLTLVQDKNPELFSEMIKQVVTQCIRGDDLFELSGEVDNMLTEASKEYKYFKCLGDVMTKAWVSNGYGEIWSKNYKHQLKYHLKKWKKCPQAGDSEAIETCNKEESKATRKIMSAAAVAMTLIDPQMFYDFSRMSKEKCVLEK